MAQANTSSVTENNKSQYFISIGIIGILFFIFGFVTWLNGTLIPFLKTACELNSFQALFVTFAFYISYFIMAIPSSWVLKKTGLKEGMSLGLLIMAIGALIFIPAAYTRIYGLFLTGLFVQGTGLAILQTASNPYITILGPKESAAARISIMGIANKVAGLLSPVILTYLVLHNMDRFSEANLKVLTPLQKAATLNELAARIVWPYVVIAIALVALAAFVKYSPLPEVEAEEDEVANTEEHHAKKNIFQFPQLILGVFTLFLYVGVEVLAGDTIGLFGKSLNISFFGRLTSYTMCAMVVGYIIGILTIPKYIKQENALVISAILGFIFSITILFTSTTSTSVFNNILGWTGIPAIPNSVFFLALCGLSNALMWPAIWPLAIDGLGRFIKLGSSLLIMAIAGGATIPLLYGRLVVNYTDQLPAFLMAKLKFFGITSAVPNQLAYWIMIPCYLWILFYAAKGNKLRTWKIKK